MYVFTYNTESGDSGVLGVFKKKPTDKKLEKIARDLMPDEFFDDNDGPGNWGSNVFIEGHGPFDPQ